MAWSLFPHPLLAPGSAVVAPPHPLADPGCRPCGTLGITPLLIPGSPVGTPPEVPGLPVWHPSNPSDSAGVTCGHGRVASLNPGVCRVGTPHPGPSDPGAAVWHHPPDPGVTMCGTHSSPLLIPGVTVVAPPPDPGFTIRVSVWHPLIPCLIRGYRIPGVSVWHPSPPSDPGVHPCGTPSLIPGVPVWHPSIPGDPGVTVPLLILGLSVAPTPSRSRGLRVAPSPPSDLGSCGTPPDPVCGTPPLPGVTVWHPS
nr:splicing factor 3A subunit 2-like [Penaeus vannamei]